MVARRSPDSSLRRIHALVERYTPDGAVGRGILGAATGTIGLWLVAIALFEIPRWGLTLSALLWMPSLLATGIPLLAFTTLVLWPLYLSLIGNLESTEEYAGPGTMGDTGAERLTNESATASSGAEPKAGTDDPLEDLKSRYERGDISEVEFERLVEDRLQESTGTPADARGGPSAEGDRSRDRNLERDRE